MKKLILVRHGETQRDKRNPDRKLTSQGIEQTRDLSRRLVQYINGKIRILHTPSLRAAQTAEIIAKQLAGYDIKPKLSTIKARVRNIDAMGTEIRKGKEAGTKPAETYLHKHSRFPSVETPQQFVARIESAIKSIIEETVLIVSHEGSLEALFYSTTVFETKYKNFDRYFSYSDFAVLHRREDVSIIPNIYRKEGAQ
ncbi:MAG: histidine phosphatase family protein [Candidatus Dojkabacteria bacterium]